ncbi:hypothetical protein GCM10007036_44740 [Alsobacter metallidurans]|uniref:Uncharacterized protein n=1 Tax=Alsobacter metallidurans TaxID=340221 RepID=A0A917MKG4_9HYPH|nr:DUF1178 family protein [Alsobacter metallidurans]GGH32672.1 hypothetical protein GCM10007036_44740 [Alsobacter metallidurans]
MIRYALACESGHSFESWFRDGASFDDQAARGLVECPHCGSAKIAKQIMAPSVARTDRDAAAPAPEPSDADGPASGPSPGGAAPVALLSERDMAFRALLAGMREHIKANAENVGRGFAAEARRMHEGLTDFRAIYGEASAEEAQALAEEGIDATAIPWLNDDRN